ncbi:OpgC domain-containing protein [Microvirga sp. ACRRW]|uniref:OpgC family protein n=1 Tax=Microvirga sp. ACRRW TaxID=2918205 RepID=UPI001EF67B17|nr:OpgC domain-containing protein [Microvirga sp. ACRRW]MCG7393074.1 OpgC domain-containing protein [Microvirga sp. ACRRW]
MAALERNTTIDFWRGLVLVIIFVNHIPGNLIEHITPRNFGFSDSTEAFIFISGLSVALVYGPKLPQGDLFGVVKRCLKRAFELYRIHLALTAGAIVLFSIGYELSEEIGLIEEHGRNAVFGDTAKGITGIILLGHQLGYFNILPLYIALMLWAPVALILARIHAGVALLVSGGVYALARMGVLTLHSWPEPGTWFFNPFAWQFLFTLGILTGLLMLERPVPYKRGLSVGAVIFLVFSALVTSAGLGLWPWLPEVAAAKLDLTKHDLGLARILHFLALAYVLAQYKIGDALKTTRIGPDLIRLGQNALTIFAVGSLLSAAGQVIMTLAAVKSSASPQLIGMVFTILGIISLLALARYLEWNKQKVPARRKEQAKGLELSPSPGRLSS